MKKLILILMIAALVLVAGCGDDDETTLNETQNVTAELCPEPEPCPECETCAECEECEACPEEVDCDISNDLVELDLNEITLSTTTLGPNEDIVVAKYTLEQYDKIESGTLTFVPDCDSKPGELEIELWDRTFYSDEPTCYVTQEVELDPSSLELGRNTITFRTEGSIDYAINDIEILTTYVDGTNDTQKLYSVSFEPTAGDTETFEKLDNVALLNYKEYELDLDSDEASEDYLLSFEGDHREGMLIIEVNGDEIYNGPVERHNEILVDSNLLKRGTNYFSFIGR